MARRLLTSRQKSSLAQIAKVAWREGGHEARSGNNSAADDPFGMPESESKRFAAWRQQEAIRCVGCRISEAENKHYRKLAAWFTQLKYGPAETAPEDPPLALHVAGEERTFSSDRSAQGTKIQALLCDRKLSWSYADAISQQMFGIDRIEWCRPSELRPVIAALIKHSKHSPPPAENQNPF